MAPSYISIKIHCLPAEGRVSICVFAHSFASVLGSPFAILWEGVCLCVFVCERLCVLHIMNVHVHTYTIHISYSHTYIKTSYSYTYIYIYIRNNTSCTCAHVCTYSATYSICVFRTHTHTHTHLDTHLDTYMHTRNKYLVIHTKGGKAPITLLHESAEALDVWFAVVGAVARSRPQ